MNPYKLEVFGCRVRSFSNLERAKKAFDEIKCGPIPQYGTNVSEVTLLKSNGRPYSFDVIARKIVPLKDDVQYAGGDCCKA